MFETDIFNSLIAGWICIIAFSSFYYIFSFFNCNGAKKNPIDEGIKIDFSDEQA